MQDFRKVDVWKRAHVHALVVRGLAQRFPRRSHTSLKSQMIRSAESIVFNIVEGCGASTRKEFARFLGISVKSTLELEYQLQLARDTAAMTQTNWYKLTAETVEIRRMLCGFIRTLRIADAKESRSRDRSRRL